MRPGQDGKRFPVTVLGLLHEIAIQPIVLQAAVRSGDASRQY